MLPLPELLDDVLERSGYRAMLADGTEEGEERWANLLELREVTTRYDDLSAEDALDRLLEETALVADQDSYQSDADMLSLITLHAAKGLEFEVVFIAGLEESLFPTGRAVEAEGGFNPDPRPMEEERRLAYVGMTRARQRLYLSHAWQRATRRGPGTSWMAEPSRFLHRDPRRAHERPAPRRPAGGRRRARLRHGRPQPRVRARRDAVRAADPAGRRGVSRGERPARGAVGGRDVPAVARPRGAARRVRGRGALGHVRASRRGRRVGRRRAGADARTTGRGSIGDAEPGRARRRAAVVDRPIIPGERRYRDGDRVRHARWGDGIVVSSKLTRSDEEVTIAFRDPQIGRKTLLASLAGLELTG